jgi:hypothetical protein
MFISVFRRDASEHLSIAVHKDNLVGSNEGAFKQQSEFAVYQTRWGRGEWSVNYAG